MRILPLVSAAILSCCFVTCKTQSKRPKRQTLTQNDVRALNRVLVRRMVKGLKADSYVGVSGEEAEYRFVQAYFTKDENPKIKNWSCPEKDEFERQEKKRAFKKLRGYKYVLLHYPQSSFLPEYDFKKNGFAFSKMKITFKRSSIYISSFVRKNKKS